MKTNRTFLLMAAIALMASCNPNVPELNENNRKMLIGTWRVTKETITNGDGFRGVVTRQENHSVWVFTENGVHVGYQTTLGFSDFTLLPYSLQQQQNGTWLLSIGADCDHPTTIGRIYPLITIHKLTKSDIEWDYKYYGGDEGPVEHYQYLKRTEDLYF